MLHTLSLSIKLSFRYFSFNYTPNLKPLQSKHWKRDPSFKPTCLAFRRNGKVAKLSQPVITHEGLHVYMCLVDSRLECNRDLIHLPGKLIRTPAVSPLLASLLLHLYFMNTSLSQFSNEDEKPCCESILQLLWKEGNQQMLRESSWIYETKSKITKLNTTDTVATIRIVSSI